jgi:cytoplasmic tRNA 2-thiolation protein 1
MRVYSKAVQRNCDRCGYISSNPICKACALLEDLAKGAPRVVAVASVSRAVEGTSHALAP